nr:hypothetical protein [Tanacetum cinerariifolium]
INPYLQQCKLLQHGQLRYISSGNTSSLAVAKYSSSEIFITDSGNELENFIPNNNNLIIQGKFEQWKFRIQQYLQNEHYALWEVIEFGDSYEVPLVESGTGSASESSTKKKGRTVAITTEDMQKRMNDVRTAQELWGAILKTFGGNEATKKTKKNQLKQLYGNFKAEGSETLEQTFNILQAINGSCILLCGEIEIILTLSLDDVYNHLKVYEPEAQKKSESNSQNMAFISSANTSIGKGEVNIASIPTASTQVSPASADVAAASISHETIDIKWNMALLSMRADRFWKETGKKITIQGTESQRGRREIYKQGSKEEEPAPKALMAIDRVGWDWSYMANEEENHALVADDKALTEFALMAKFNSSFENEVKKEKDGLDSKLTCFESAFKDLDTLLGSQRSDKNKEGLGYNDTISDYSMPSPSIESNSNVLQNSNSSVSEHGESSRTILFKPMIKFVKAADSPTDIKTNNVETVRKSSDSGCSRHMTGNISYLSDYEPYDRGYVSFRQVGGKITSKGIIKTGKLEFKNVYFVKDLKCNMFSVSHICDNKNSVLFIDSECIMLGRDFKLKDDTNVLLRTPRQHNMYSIDLNNIVPHKDLTCLVAKASTDESMLWHRRLGHLNFKTMNKLVRHNLVKVLPSKCFKNDHTCVACLNGKQHKESCKTKLVNSVSKPLHTLHMDMFGPTSVSSFNHKWYWLVVTDDFSRFTSTFFLKTKDETSGILRNFITGIENLKDLKVKIIRCDNGGEFKNKEMNEFCTRKGIKKEFSNARTPQQNRVAERRNKTLIEAARTMVLVNKSQNKTPYELFNNRTLAIGFLRPFGCHVMILNTLYHLGKFDAKGDEGYFVGYTTSSKAFRVFNKRTKKVEENMHVDFLENKLIEKGAGPNWLFDIDTLTNSMNYVPVVVAGTSSTNFLGTKDVVSQDVKKDVSSLRCIALPNWFHEVHLESSTSNAQDTCNTAAPESIGNSIPTATSKNPPTDQMETLTVESIILTVSSPVPTACLDTSPGTTSSSRLISKEGEGSGTPTEPHHTPSPPAQQSPHHDSSSSLHPTATTETIPTSKALPTVADEPASLLRDDCQGEVFPTVSGLESGQDRENIIKTSTWPYDSTPRVTSFDADDSNLEISTLKARIKLLEDKDKGSAKPSRDDAPIKGRSLETWEEVGVERSTKQGSNDTEGMVNVLTSMDAANILTSGVADVSVPPTAEVSTVGVSTGSGLVPTVSAILTTATVVTPYSRRPREISAKDKGKEKMVESDTPNKKRLQEQIDVQMAREMEEQMAREDQRMDEQIARDAEIARIYAEEELQMLIDGLDRNNEVIAKHLQEYEQCEAELTIGEKIDLINEMVKYQDHHAKILKYQAQQSKPLSKKEQREFYMSVLRSHSGWKTKHFRGMTLEEIKEKFIPGSAKRMKTSEEVSEENLKEMMQLVPVEEVYVEALHVKHPIIEWEIHTEGERDYWKIIRLGGHTTVYQFFMDMLKQLDREDLNRLWTLVKETLSIRLASSDKKKDLWVELKRLFEPNFEGQLWIHTSPDA